VAGEDHKCCILGVPFPTLVPQGNPHCCEWPCDPSVWPSVIPFWVLGKPQRGSPRSGGPYPSSGNIPKSLPEQLPTLVRKSKSPGKLGYRPPPPRFAGFDGMPPEVSNRAMGEFAPFLAAILLVTTSFAAPPAAAGKALTLKVVGVHDGARRSPASPKLTSMCRYGRTPSTPPDSSSRSS